MKHPIITDWKPEYASQYGNKTLLLHHRLHESGLFTAEALAELTDRCSSDYYNLSTMGYDMENPVWREGCLGDHKGEDVIRAVERGRMWFNLRKVEELDERYARVLDDIFAEFEGYVPGLATFKRKLGILISSPKVQVFYHSDVPGQSLWQIQGEKRVYIYPNRAPYLMQKELESVILGETEEEISYDPKFDEAALVVDLQPGQMAHWPLNGPHRVQNADMLNISLTTEHWTSDIRKSYAVNYANGVLRRRFGLNNLSQSIHGPAVYPKAVLAMAWRKLGLNDNHEVARMIDFQVDPDSETGMREIPAFRK